MYFVDRELLERRLLYLDNITKIFSEKSKWEGEIDQLALERIVHMFIETVIDVGNQMIDGFIMRDPGSYFDIIDILVDERVINENEGDSLKEVIKLRKDLVRHYEKIDHDELQSVLKKEWNNIILFTERVRDYLNNELGPVNAFIPKK